MCSRLIVVLLILVGVSVASTGYAGSSSVISSGSTWKQLSGSNQKATAATCKITRGPYFQLSRQSSIIVRWRTDVACDSRTRFGRTPDNLNIVVDNPKLTTEHILLVRGLQSWQTYYHSVGTRSATLAAGRDFRLITSPDDHHPGVIQRFWALGNVGTGDANQAAVRNAYLNFTAGSKPANLVLLLGDNAFPGGKDSSWQRNVFNMYSTVLRRTSVLPTLSHIDTAGSTNPPLTIPYFQIFNLPPSFGGGGVPSGTEKYFGYNFGIIHIVCLDSQTSDLSPNGAMLTWLRRDLEANTFPWLIAYFHHAPYSRGSRNSDADQRMIQMRTNVLPILERYGVDLVLGAHSHSYERSYFLNGHYGFSNSLSNSMIVTRTDGRSVTVGGQGVYTKQSGARNAGTVYAVVGSSGKVVPAPLNHPAMVVSRPRLGSLVFDVFNNKLDARFIQSDGSIGDQFTIIKQNQKPTISLTSPQNGASYNRGANIPIIANVNDVDTHVQRAIFYANGKKLFDDYSRPYAGTWTNVPAGTYSITAEVRDDLGATTKTGPNTITVK